MRTGVLCCTGVPPIRPYVDYNLTIARPLSQYHVDSNGRVNFAQSDVLIHVVNKDTNQIMDVSR